MQHPDGGFAGGPGQVAHLLPTYAAVCSLAIVGRPGDGGGWDNIDRCATDTSGPDSGVSHMRGDVCRQKMYDFFMSLKQRDGSFLVSHHGEVDVRSAVYPPSRTGI